MIRLFAFILGWGLALVCGAAIGRRIAKPLLRGWRERRMGLLNATRLCVACSLPCDPRKGDTFEAGRWCHVKCRRQLLSLIQ